MRPSCAAASLKATVSTNQPMVARPGATSDCQNPRRCRGSGSHPTNPDIVYVGVLGHVYGDNEDRGVYRSTDGGSTWEKILYKSDKAGAADLIIDRRNPRILYASLWQVYRKAWKMWGGGPDSGLYKSENGGDTWVELTANPGMPEGPVGKIGVTVSPVDSDRVWAIVEANEGGVFRSEDGGATWRRTNEERKLSATRFLLLTRLCRPTGPDTVYALNTGFYKSIDGGETFDIVIRPPHGDQHDLWIDPNNPARMCNSNDGGGNVSVNGGESWTEQDFVTTQLYHVNVTMTCRITCAALSRTTRPSVSRVTGGAICSLAARTTAGCMPRGA